MKRVFTFQPAFDRNSVRMRGNSKPPTCCFCFHVSAGTIIYAMISLVLALFGVVFATLFLTGQIHYSEDGGAGQSFFMYNSELSPTQTYWVVFVNGLFFVLLSSFCVYGVVKNRAGFILPFFIVQLFDFLCTMVYAGSVVFFWPRFQYKLAECQHLPEEWKAAIINMDQRWLACIVFLALFLVIFIKCYLISMVYRCYKHITLQVIMRRGQSEITSVSGGEEEKSIGIHIYTPPKYDDIQKIPLVDDVEDMDSKPPPYEAA